PPQWPRLPRTAGARPALPGRDPAQRDGPGTARRAPHPPVAVLLLLAPGLATAAPGAIDDHHRPQPPRAPGAHRGPRRRAATTAIRGARGRRADRRHPARTR